MSKKKKTNVPDAKKEFSKNALGKLGLECDKFEDLLGTFNNLTDILSNNITEIKGHFEKETTLKQIMVTWMTLYYFLVDYFHLIVDGHVNREIIASTFEADIQELYKYTLDKNTKAIVKKPVTSGLHGYLGYLTDFSEESHKFWIYSISYLDAM